MKVLMIGNAGGHFEQLKQLKRIEKKYQLFYVTNKCLATEKLGYVDNFILAPHFHSKLLTLCGYFINSIQAFFILLKIKPELIVSTGAGIAIPTCILGKILGKKIVFIESFARIDFPSRTGKFMYKVADIFIVQHKSLLKYYPKAIYGGWIY